MSATICPLRTTAPCSRCSASGETLEGWIAQHTLEDGVGKADLSAPVYGFAPDTDAAFVATINLDGSCVWEKWVNGEKVDERHHGPGETINWPW